MTYEIREMTDDDWKRLLEEEERKPNPSNRPVRAITGEHIFPDVVFDEGGHWQGHVALGNGTQWEFALVKAGTSAGREYLLVDIVCLSRESAAAKHQCLRVGEALPATYIKTLFPRVGGGDVGNVTDFLNDQVMGGIRVKRQGHYHEMYCAKPTQP